MFVLVLIPVRVVDILDGSLIVMMMVVVVVMELTVIVDMSLLVMTLPHHSPHNIDLGGVMIVIEDKSSLLVEGKMTSVKMMTIVTIGEGYCYY